MTVISQALDKLKLADEARSKYTRLDVEHNQNFFEDGKKFSDTRRTYEDTWLYGFPYKNLVAMNGRPLSGKTLDEEKARFEKAVGERKGFDLAERAKVVGGKHVQEEFELEQILGSGYTLQTLKSERLHGARCHVYLAEPQMIANPSAEADSAFEYKLWITDTDPFLLKLEISRRGGVRKRFREEHGLIEWQLLDGLPVETHTRFTAFMDVDGRMIEARTDDVYSAYRRFTSSVRIIPGQMESNSAPKPSSNP